MPFLVRLEDWHLSRSPSSYAPVWPCGFSLNKSLKLLSVDFVINRLDSLLNYSVQATWK